MDHGTLKRWLRGIYGGRSWLVASDMAGKGIAIMQSLHRMGASPGLLLTAYSDDRYRMSPSAGIHCCLDVDPSSSVMDAVSRADDALTHLTGGVKARLDTFDKEQSIRALAPVFSKGRPIGGRLQFGARPQAWQELEDKLVIDEVWDKIGVGRLPSETCPREKRALHDACMRLDQGAGVVLSEDDSRGVHGGAQGTWWVKRVEELEECLSQLDLRVQRLRVMPFVEGVPCGIHGLVLPDGVVTGRPAEMLTLRSSKARGLTYCRFATTWVPSAEVRAELSEVVRRTGRWLSATLGYRGAFGIDGVLSREGFVPTELNPRIGAAMSSAWGVDFAELYLWNQALVEGCRWSVPAHEVQEWCDALAMVDRKASIGIFVPSLPVSPGRQWLKFFGGQWRQCATGTPGAAVATWGPGPVGVSIELEDPAWGMSTSRHYGPRAQEFARWCEVNLGVDLGRPVAARQASSLGALQVTDAR